MDVKKTLKTWEAMSTEALRLKCNQYSLITTGRKKALANRLYNHFKTKKQGAAQNNNDSDPTLQDLFAELRGLRSEIEEIKSSRGGTQTGNSCIPNTDPTAAISSGDSTETRQQQQLVYSANATANNFVTEDETPSSNLQAAIAGNDNPIRIKFSLPALQVMMILFALSSPFQH